uniref:Leucine rich repeat containing 40 n=1 Tax=Xiphophorus couchianus TaxID=32473 RepID=A0A3B5KQF1_9TELE
MSRFKRAGNVDSLAGFRTPKPEAAVPYGLLRTARKSGQLNLSGRGLTEVPQNVYRLNVDEPAEAQENVSFGGSDCWWEQTNLTKLLLSSNQLTQMSEDIKLLPALTILDVIFFNILVTPDCMRLCCGPIHCAPVERSPS